MLKLLAITFTLLAVTFSQAHAERVEKTKEDLLSAGGTPEEIGLAIITEADNRDFGFGDFEVELLMVLRNAQGEESKREQRNKTFEVKDKSVGDKTLIIFDRPRDVKGTAFLTYSKILEPDDQWLYLPSLKHINISSKMHVVIKNALWLSAILPMNIQAILSR
jgi:hypothetical protein